MQFFYPIFAKEINRGMLNNTDVRIAKLSSILAFLDFEILPTNIEKQCCILERKIEEYNKIKNSTNVEDENLQKLANHICNEATELINFLTEYIAEE